MKNSCIFCILMFLVLNGATAGTISGIVKKDTVLSFGGSPYVISNQLQIARGATLTVEAGAELRGGELFVSGTFKALGTAPDNRVKLQNVSIKAFGDSNSGGKIEIRFAEISHGSLYRGEGNGNIILTDSVIRDLDNYLYIWYPNEDCFIERNVFSNFEHLSVGVSDGHNVYIKNNVFHNSTSEENKAIRVWATYSGSQVVVQHNSFLDHGNLVGLSKGYDSATMEISENYWGTCDISEVEKKIVDKNDDIRYAQFLNYEPILLTPHKDTPRFPIAEPAAIALAQPIKLENATLTGLAGVQVLCRNLTTNQEIKIEVDNLINLDCGVDPSFKVKPGDIVSIVISGQAVE